MAATVAGGGMTPVGVHEKSSYRATRWLETLVDLPRLPADSGETRRHDQAERVRHDCGSSQDSGRVPEHSPGLGRIGEDCGAPKSGESLSTFPSTGSRTFPGADRTQGAKVIGADSEKPGMGDEGYCSRRSHVLAVNLRPVQATR